jgi:site-specific DNA-methyltransferase (adenine-specific)
MAASRKKTEYQSRRRDDATFDWDAFLRKAAGRVLEVGDLPPEVREAVANGGSTAVAECGYTVETSAIWPEYLSGDQLVFWPEDKPCNPDEAARVFPLAPKCAYEADDGKLFTGDSVLWLKTLPSESVDLVFADPPYNIGKAAWDMFQSEEAYLNWCDVWVEEVARILKPTGSFYICGFSEILADVKYRVAPHFSGCRWLIWHYKNKANLGNDWGRSHESIVHFRKSAKFSLNIDDIRIPYNAHTLKYPEHPQSESSAFSHGDISSRQHWKPNPLGAKPKDVVELPTTCNGMGEKTPHPTQKPEALLRKLILAASKPGDLVVDPFSGSGTTLVTARQLKRNWLGCDLSAQYNEWAIQRLQSVPEKPIDYWMGLDKEVMARREAIR